MIPSRKSRTYLALGALAIAGVFWAGHDGFANLAMQAGQGSGDRKVRTELTQDLPRLDGNRLKASVVEITYAPGASSPAHSHSCPVIGYVVSGELRTQVKGSAEVTYKAGAAFYEPPNGVHLISANASRTDPAKLLAVFICDHQTELSTPASAEPDAGGS
jgi:quercetin dioxygenase-like cupin family protein